MRPVTLNPNDVPGSLREVDRASHDNDTTELAQNFTFTGSLTETTDLDLSSPSAANIAAVLATLINAMQKGGINRTT